MQLLYYLPVFNVEKYNTISLKTTIILYNNKEIILKKVSVNPVSDANAVPVVYASWSLALRMHIWERRNTISRNIASIVISRCSWMSYEPEWKSFYLYVLLLILCICLLALLIISQTLLAKLVISVYLFQMSVLFQSPLHSSFTDGQILQHGSAFRFSEFFPYMHLVVGIIWYNFLILSICYFCFWENSFLT